MSPKSVYRCQNRPRLAPEHVAIDGFQCLHFNGPLLQIGHVSGRQEDRRCIYMEIATKGRENGELEGIRL